MTIYTVTLRNDETFLISVDTARAESNITATWDLDLDPADTTWHPTPFQCADACHSAEAAADLVEGYFADAAGVDRTPVQSVKKQITESDA